MGRCCVCIYRAQVCYTLCGATALLFHPNPPSSSLLPPQPVPLPCRALQRGESSRRTVFCLPVPPDSVSLSPESAASFCPHCTSFRKERNEERMINVVHQCYQQVSTLYRNPGFQTNLHHPELHSLPGRVSAGHRGDSYLGLNHKISTTNLAGDEVHVHKDRKCASHNTWE